MSRENILFSVVGLLLGYVIAFHLVVYINQSQAQAGAGAGGGASAAGLPADHPSLSGDESEDRRRLLSEAEEAAQAARKEPQNFDAQLKAAEGFIRAGSYEDAIDFMTRANRLRPEDYETVVRLGSVYSAAERFEDAAQWYTAALAKKPDDCDTRSELALTYYLRKPPQAERALAELRRCLESDPNHVPSLHNLAMMLMETKRFDDSAAALDRLEKADPAYDQLPRLRRELEKARGGAAQKKTPAD
ncbi:MAG TPA: tetratricopeptide repeat protein [Pyrinomonadaceae bacterium]|jgi:tetratricopeptide (TPR) repeat protein